RYHISVEKWIKQLTIEAEMMVSIARTQILPAALKQQTMIAETACATEAAGVDCDDTVKALEHFSGLVSDLRTALTALDTAIAHEDADPLKHAQQIRSKVRPAMAVLRSAVDTLETHVDATLWPLPTYRELLFLK
ncbi:MAG TPA: hypothetical protein PLJ23_04450, partial [Gemmatimonadales bacterium]|nr:hypothetical protein [Gemmatimonadales bacterium]